MFYYRGNKVIETDRFDSQTSLRLSPDSYTRTSDKFTQSFGASGLHL